MQHIWYWPEYGPDYYTMSLMNTLIGSSVKTIQLNDVICGVHEENLFSIESRESLFPQA